MQIKTVNNCLLMVSGGVDSMSLLHFFINKHLKFEVLHVNHLTRPGENELEASAIQKICKAYQIPFHYVEYHHTDGNFQAKAREFRLSKAVSIVKDNNLNVVVLGHHKDDNVENILMHEQKISFRGINEYSMYNDVKLYRPLLDIFKREIYEYAKENSIKYFEDYSNHETHYLRNKYRNNVLKHLTEDEKQQIIDNEIKRVSDHERQVTSTLNVEGVTEEQLYYFIKSKLKTENISRKLLNGIITHLKCEGTQVFTLPNNWELLNQYGTMKMVKKDSEQLITKEQELLIGLNTFNGIEFVNDLPNGIITTRRCGDKIVVNNCTKKVTKYMIDLKIPSNLRDIWPIIRDHDNNVLYIPKATKK